MATATHSTILPWEISWSEKPGGLQSMGLQRTGHDLETKQKLLNGYGVCGGNNWGINDDLSPRREHLEKKTR